jgi:DeoR family glycerol-3-phosphate regulon repressor
MEATNFLRRFNVRHAILSVGAVNAVSGFMLHDLEEAEYSREAARRAENRIIVADSAKFGRSAPIIIDDPSIYDMMVTDDVPPPDIRAMLDRNEIDLVVANQRRMEQR